MHKQLLHVAIVLLGAAVLASGKSPVYLSPQALVAGPGNTLYVADYGAEQVAVVDLAEGVVSRVIPLDGPVYALAISTDGGTLLATEALPRGFLVVIDTASGRRQRIAVGHTPSAVAMNAEASIAYVCNRFGDDVSVVDLDRREEVQRIEVVREPVACALTPDDSILYVANHLPAGRADGEYAGAAISAIWPRENHRTRTIPMPNGSTGVRGLCVSPDGAFVYVTHILARYQLPTTQLERGWMNTNAVTVLDAVKAESVNTFLLDDVDLGAANPWGIVCSEDGHDIVVAHAGTHEISVIDRLGLHERLTRAATGEKVTSVTDSAEDVSNDLSFLVDLRRRLKLAGNGPRGVAVSGDLAYAAEFFSGSVGVVSLDAEAVHRPGSIALGPKQELTKERHGERNFNDASMCFQHWQSCASCHPDGRADGLNWDLLNDGMGNPKQTKSMLLSHVTPPVMVTGIRPDAETAVRAGMKFIQFAVRPEEDLEAVDAYLRSLEPVMSPHRSARGRLSRAARRGRKVFEEAGCAHCHPEPLYTDLQKYNVGIGTGRHRETSFDTPTLIECWRTEPYLYDGRAATMMDVLTTFNKGNTHGRTADLSEEDLSDLNEFILSH